MPQHIIMGIPVFMPEGLPKAPQPYRGSIQVPCSECGRIVWQGPAQQLLKSEHPEYPIICAICCIEMEGPGILTAVVPLTDKRAGD